MYTVIGGLYKSVLQSKIPNSPHCVRLRVDMDSVILNDSYCMIHTKILSVLRDFLMQSSPKRNCISSSRMTLHLTMLRVSGIKSFPALFYFLNDWLGGRPRGLLENPVHGVLPDTFRTMTTIPVFPPWFYLAWISLTITLLLTYQKPIEACGNTLLIYWYRFIPVLTGIFSQKCTYSRNNSLTP